MLLQVSNRKPTKTRGEVICYYRLAIGNPLKPGVKSYATAGYVGNFSQVTPVVFHLIPTP